MIKKLNFKILTFLFLMIFLSSSAMAFGLHSPGDGGFGCPMKSFINNILGFTDEQIAEMDALKTEIRESITPLVEQMKDLTISEALLADPVDTVQAYAQFEIMSGLEAQMSAVKLDAALTGAQILTFQQRGRILAIVTFFTDLVQYINIKDFPGWDMIKELHEKYDRPEFIKEKYSHGAHGDHSFIDLTDEQKTDFENLKDSTLSEIRPLITQFQQAALEMIPLLLAEKIVEADVIAKQASISSLKSQIAAIGYDAAIEGAEILTAEQRLAILEKIQEREEWMNGDHGGCPYLESMDDGDGFPFWNHKK